MKVRLLAGSIRFRLKQPEVSQFRQSGSVTEVLEFGPEPTDQLRFCLKVTEDAHLSVSLQACVTTIGVPKALAEEWVLTNQVGIEGQVETGKGKSIRVLIEKDFACLNGSEAENVGTYPNPADHC